ncbi:hypothetical protein BS47DRAFT_1366624 [Hydnum rufescens UP504]|uniref:Uncharacterized protein n=1 Tax=Hydnum rufescens UP504 TaxID=1448309 RepID=A0A9P6AKL9_9AGAM|nr:hypothetical protein BS47DRAFT_1366624 [Hydnum rufescens UP504]
MVRAPGTGFEFRILCEGEYLPEHSVVAEGDKITCWVASKEGKAFKIDMASESAPDPPGTMLRAVVYFNGSEKPAGAYNKEASRGKSDDTQPSEDWVTSVGTIRLRLNHVYKVGPGFYEAPPAVSQGAITPPALNERSNKGGGHISTDTSLGAELGVSKAGARHRVDVIPNTPSLNIIFHYAPEELLIARGIIPGLPSPPPVIEPATWNAAVKREREETDNDASALTDEETDAYARLKAPAKKRAKNTSVRPEPTDISTRIFDKGESMDICD